MRYSFFKFKKYKILLTAIVLILLIVLFISQLKSIDTKNNNNTDSNAETQNISEVVDNSLYFDNLDLNSIPEYSGKPYTEINSNIPSYSLENITNKSFEYYSKLDKQGRCGICLSNIGLDTMPDKKRESISSVKPTGWKSTKYDDIDGKNLYNRCHLIGYQLTAENANKCNLITGTRYLNVEGMLPFENMVADYIKETGNHVLYRSTPIFCGNDMVARGVHMEAISVEDKGEGICYNVFCYNVQPGIVIDYATGNSHLEKNR